MRFTTRWLAALLAAAPSASAQVIPGEIVAPGSTLATTTDADSARLNAGAVALLRGVTARATHVTELRGNTALDADALTVAAPLALGVAGAAGVSWSRPSLPRASGHVVTADLSLAYAILRGLGAGARLRISGAGSANGPAPAIFALDGAAAIDLGLAWRPFPWLAVALVGNNLLGPRAPSLGVDRTLLAGLGLRPFETDALTFGLDGALTQSGTGWARAGARVRVPYVGYVRAEGAVDYPAGAWRAGAGLELVWGELSAGGGALVGSTGAPGAGLDGPLGFYATAALAPERGRGIPEPSVAVVIALDEEPGPRAMSRLLLQLERLRRDPTVRGVLFAPHDGVGGLAHAEELREAFARLRAAGKRVACHLTEPNGSAYDACAAVDTIAMDPAGSMRMAGLRASRYFLGDALARLGVRTEFVRVGAWKSAPEQFTRAGSTPEGRAQEEQLLDDFYANLLGSVSAGRHTTREHAQALVEAGPSTAREALSSGLIDAVETREGASRALSHTADASALPLSAYVARRPQRWAPGRAVAVLHIDGDIADGESFELPFVGMRMVGERSVVAQVEALADDPRVGAIVLRVDSPGGSATASEMMWRALARAARRKPLVASFGRIAASGGYYIAAPAREIFTDASTLAGSIGIFFGKADVSGLLANLGVGLELSRRGPRADIESLFRASTADERAAVARLMLAFYQTFLARVSAGRHMSLDAVNAVGEGRVFSGARAVQVGLADHEGGLLAAIDRARALAGLSEDADVLDYPPPATGLLELVSSLVAAEPALPPASRLLGAGDAAAALRWIAAVAFCASPSGPLALSEWPLAPAE